jgi:hypothetical protein
MKFALHFGNNTFSDPEGARGASATPPSASLYRERIIYTRDRPLLARSGRSVGLKPKPYE